MTQHQNEQMQSELRALYSQQYSIGLLVQQAPTPLPKGEHASHTCVCCTDIYSLPVMSLSKDHMQCTIVEENTAMAKDTITVGIDKDMKVEAMMYTMVGVRLITLDIEV